LFRNDDGWSGVGYGRQKAGIGVTFFVKTGRLNESTVQDCEDTAGERSRMLSGIGLIAWVEPNLLLIS